MPPLMSFTRTRLHLKTFSLIGALFLSACSSLPDQKSVERRAASLSEQAISSSRLLQRAKTSMQKARSQELAVYAPTYFTHAQSHYQQAVEAYKQKLDKTEIRLNAHLSMEFVNAGLRTKKLVLEHLPRSLKHRQALKDLDAPKHKPLLADAVEKQYLDVVHLIEMQKMDDVKGAQKALLKAMHQLEVKVIDATYLGKAQLMLQQAQAISALELMPQTFKQAQDKLSDAQQFIRQNPRDILNIEEYSNEALFYCERLYSLTRFARQLNVAQENQLESLVLQQEEHLGLIREGLIAKDNSNLSLQDQSILLGQSAQDLIKENQRILKEKGKASHKDLEKWRRKVVLLQTEVRRLQKLLKKAKRY